MTRFLMPALAAAVLAGGFALPSASALAQNRSTYDQNRTGATATGDPWLNEHDFDYNRRHWIPGPGGSADDSRYNYGGQSYGAQNYGGQSYGAQNYGAQNYGAQNYGAQNYRGRPGDQPTATGNAWLNEHNFEYNRRHWTPGPGGNQSSGYGQNWSGGQGSYGQSWSGSQGGYGGYGNQPYSAPYGGQGYSRY